MLAKPSKRFERLLRPCRISASSIEDATIDGDSLSDANAVLLGHLQVLVADRRDGFQVLLQGASMPSSRWPSTHCTSDAMALDDLNGRDLLARVAQSMSSPALMLGESSSGMHPLRQIHSGSRSRIFDTLFTMSRAA